MNSLTIKAAVAALLVSAPLASAFATDYSEDYHPVDRFRASSAVDLTTTSSLGAPTEASYRTSLETRIVAAEANLAPTSRGALDVASAQRLKSELRAVRQAANANGGQLSSAEYNQLTSQINAIQQQIYTLKNG